MGQNLTGKTIASTYEDLVQISGSILTDGLGNNITSLTVTASYASQAGTAGYATTAGNAGTAGFATSASFATTASYALNVPSFNTGSLMITGSVSTNVLTFEKGDGSTFSLTVATGSAVTTPTGSLLVTASISDATITFTKGDASTFPITVNNVQNASTASTAGTAGYAFTAGTAGFATSASWADQAGTAGYAATAGTSGFATSASFADQAGTAGYATTAGTAGFATSASFANQAGTAGYAATAGTAGFATSASLALNNVTTASVSLNTITFTKGDGTTFPITVDTGSGAPAFPFTGSAAITGSLSLTGSFSALYENTASAFLIQSRVSTGAGPNVGIMVNTSGSNNPFDTTGGGNVLFGTAPSNNIARFITGSGNYNILGGQASRIYGRVSNALVLGGQGHSIASGSELSATAQSNHIILGGNGGNILHGTGNGLIAALTATILSGSSDTTPSYNVIVGGQSNAISGSDYAAIIAGRLNNISNGAQSVIVGGTGSLVSVGNAGAFAARGAVVSHTGSVVVGGFNLSTTRENEVVVPNLSAIGNLRTGTTTNTIGGTSSAIAGGNNNTSGTGASLFIGGGEGNSNNSLGIGTGILAGGSNTIASGVNWGTIVGGFGNSLTGNQSHIIGANTSTNAGAATSIIVGGTSNNITSGAGNGAAAVLGGTNNTSGHDRSVVIGGQGMSTTAVNQVVVPNLLVSGSATFRQGAIITGSVVVSSGSYSGSFIDNISNITGSTQVNHVAYCTQAQYDAITPNADTLYFISQSGPITVAVTQPNTASLDCSLGNMFIIDATYSSISGSVHVTATNFTAGTIIYIKTDDSDPAYVNTIFDPAVFTTGSFTNPDNYAIQAVSFDGVKLNFVAGNSYVA